MEYSEAEQRERISKWWRQYGRHLLVAVVVGLLLGYGWRYYKARKLQHIAAASLLYRQVMLVPLLHPQTVNSGALVAAQEITKKYADTAYAGMSYLWLAKNAVLAKNLPQAVTYLQQAHKHSRDSITKQIARLRLSRVLAKQGKSQQALKELATVDNKAYLPMISAVKGDIYYAEKAWGKAKSAYITAQSGYAAAGIENQLLAHKIAQLSLHVAAKDAKKTTTKQMKTK